MWRKSMDDRRDTKADTVELPDRVVSLRRLGEQDADAVLVLREHLPHRDRYRRFFAMRPVHPKQLARQLTETTSTCCAIGAFDADRLIGVANSVTWPRPFAAEAVGRRAGGRFGEVADDREDAQRSSPLVIWGSTPAARHHADQLLAECLLAGTSLDGRGAYRLPGDDR
jgi:hypothetical protein